MGWSDGKGLGQKQNGAVSHIRVRKNKSNASEKIFYLNLMTICGYSPYQEA